MAWLGLPVLGIANGALRDATYKQATGELAAHIRRFYRGSEWHQAIDLAKHLAADRGVNDWKSICEGELSSTPVALSSKVKEASEMMYKTIANELSKVCDGQESFPGAWDFDTLIHKI